MCINDEGAGAGICTVSSRDSEYADLHSIARSTDLSPEQLWYCIVKEVMENFIDEFKKRGLKNPQLSISRKIVDENFLALKFKGNFFAADLDETFIQRIFSHEGTFTSTKRNFVTELMGSLGRASVVYSCISLAQARQLGIPLKWPVVTIRVGSKQFKVFKNYDERLQRIITKVVEESVNPIDGTEFEVAIAKPINIQKFDGELKQMVRLYSIFNPEAHFVLNLDGATYEYGGTGTLKWRKWLTSIHWFGSLQQFKQLIFSLDDEVEVHTLLKFFREGYSISFPNIKIKDLKRSEEQIERLYNALKSAMEKMPPSNYFEPRKRAVRMALIKAFGRLKSFAYEVSTGEYCQGEASIPFAIECFAFSSPTLRHSFYVDAINCAPCLASHFFEVWDDDQIFTLKVDGKNGMDSEVMLYPSAAFILRNLCNVDLSPEDKGKKKKVCVFLNLITPGVVWLSYGKSKIDITPFKEAIGEALYKVGSAVSGVGETRKQKQHKEIAKELLEQRLKEINNYGWEYVSTNNLWTRSTFFYIFRKYAYEKYGILPKELGRDYITSLIEIVTDQMGVKREQLCIFAEPRARIYFRGKDYPITYQNLETLAKLGVIILVIEKEGVAAKLKKWADILGIALIDSKGFLVEYAKDLIELSEKYGARIAALTDFDSQGVYMILQLKKEGLTIPRVGLWRQDIHELGFSEEWVREAAEKKANGKPTHYDALKDFVGKDLSKCDYEFLKDWRIELDSVMTNAEETEKMWNLIIEKLQQLFPNVDYTRSINIPSGILLTTVIEALTEKLQEIEDEILKTEREKCLSELGNWNLKEKGWIKVEEKEEELKQSFLETLKANIKVKNLIKTIEELKTKLEEWGG